MFQKLKKLRQSGDVVHLTYCDENQSIVLLNKDTLTMYHFPSATFIQNPLPTFLATFLPALSQSSKPRHQQLYECYNMQKYDVFWVPCVDGSDCWMVCSDGHVLVGQGKKTVKVVQPGCLASSFTINADLKLNVSSSLRFHHETEKGVMLMAEQAAFHVENAQ